MWIAVVDLPTPNGPFSQSTFRIPATDRHYARAMDFSSVNYVAVVVATLVGFMVNFAWFGPLKMYIRWNKALGRTEPPTPEEMPGMPFLFGMTLLGLFVESTVLAALMGGLWESATVAQGVGLGLAAGVGIASTTALGHRLFSAQGMKVWAIEVGADIVVAAVIGALLAAIG